VQKEIEENNSSNKIVIKKMYSEECASDEPDAGIANPQ
jgi:hypothetical protein